MLVVNGMTERAVTAGLAAGVPFDLDAAWRRFDGPVLLTNGAKDALVNLAMARSLQRIRPDARLSVYPESGHSPFYENSPRFGSELAAFVRRATERARRDTEAQYRY
jgi:pimeloyl-ACP methyl ester carboxylesterase